MKHHNQLRSGSLLTYVQMTLNIIVSVAYTPFMLRILGKSEYGLYSTCLLYTSDAADDS